MTADLRGYRGTILLSVCLAPVLAGAIVYYSLRRQFLPLANTANRWGYLAFALWIAAYVGFGLAGFPLPRSVAVLSSVTGIVLASVSVSRVKRAQGPSVKLPIDDFNGQV